MKPRIFIGSSREGRAKAEIIKTQLSSIADCQIWDEGFFENNKSSFESLAEGATLFDFAILVATQDDIQLKRDSLEVIARDNIIFEFGLYVGRLGRHRSFFLKEAGLDLPSDLYGVTIPEFKSPHISYGSTLEELCEKIKKNVEEVWKIYHLSFVPSTVLAVGYFENFVSKVCRELKQSSKRIVAGKNFADFKLHVIIPDELPNNFNDQVISYLSNKGLKQMEVQTNTRNYNFYLDYSSIENSVLELYDLPTTLSALKKSIETALPKGHIGESERERILKQKEMNNFCRAFNYLIKENPITKQHVDIEFIDIHG
jgi:ribose 5-phosphate isomerase RpiB